MRFKFDELEQVMAKLQKHSQRGDIEVVFDNHERALVFNYVSVKETETELRVYESDLGRFPTVMEKKWLKND